MTNKQDLNMNQIMELGTGFKGFLVEYGNYGIPLITLEEINEMPDESFEDKVKTKIRYMLAKSLENFYSVEQGFLTSFKTLIEERLKVDAFEMIENKNFTKDFKGTNKVYDHIVQEVERMIRAEQEYNAKNRFNLILGDIVEIIDRYYTEDYEDELSVLGRLTDNHVDSPIFDMKNEEFTQSFKNILESASISDANWQMVDFACNTSPSFDLLLEKITRYADHYIAEIDLVSTLKNTEENQQEHHVQEKHKSKKAEKLFLKDLNKTLDNLIGDLVVMPDVVTGGCAIAAFSIAEELHKLKKYFPDFEIGYSILSREKNIDGEQYELFEKEYMKKDKDSIQKCYELMDNGAEFSHIMVKATLGDLTYFIDGRNYYNSLEDCLNAEDDNLIMIYETKNHEFIKDFSHDVQWWRINRYDEPQLYIQDMKDIVKRAFRPLLKKADKYDLKTENEQTVQELHVQENHFSPKM